MDNTGSSPTNFSNFNKDQLYKLASRLATNVNPSEVEAACDAIRAKPTSSDTSTLGKRPSSSSSSSSTTTTSSSPTSQPPIKKSKKNKQRKKKRPFNHSRFRRRHVAIRVCYIGINYHGFAIQDDSLTTVELELYRALEKTCLIEDRVSCKYSRCGRTDTGVSALGQVIGVWVRSKQLCNAADTDTDTNTNTTTQTSTSTSNSSTSPLLSHTNEMDYAAMLNRVLPEDIRCIAWCPVPDHFSARFSCSYRTYRYYFAKRQLNLDLMQQAGTLLTGKHDYRNFCKMDVVNVRNYERELLSCTIHEAMPSTNTGEDLYYIEFKGTAFLWHQVRYMVAVLFLVGAGKENPSVVAWLLDIKNNARKPLYDMASELPLVLYKCGFEEATFMYTKHVVQRLLLNFEKMWNRHAIKGMLSRAFLGGIVNDYVLQEGIECASGGTLADEDPNLKLQQSDYEPLLLQTKSVYQSLSTRQTGMSYEERVDTLSDRKMALRNFHDERKVEALENPDNYDSHRREKAIAGLDKERTKE